MEPSWSPSTQEQYMLDMRSGLSNLEQRAAMPSLRTAGVDPCLEPLFHLVSRMEGIVPAKQPAAAGQVTEDCLDKIVYHALLMAFLAKRAIHARRADNPDEEEADRIKHLQTTVDEHSLSWLPLGYTIRGLHFAELSPVTLVSHRTTLYVACRGSTKVKEYLADASVVLQPIGGTANMVHGVGKAHKGILNAFAMQVRGVLDRVGFLVGQGGVEAVVFCGHSLGGALAQLLGLAYGQRCMNPPAANGSAPLRARVISFGCPRLGDSDFTHLLSEYTNHDRLFVDKDPIAGVPSPNTMELSGLVPDVQQYAPHHATCSWKLQFGCQAEESAVDQPLVSSMVWSVFSLHRHRLTAYASTLKHHRDQCPDARCSISGDGNVGV